MSCHVCGESETQTYLVSATTFTKEDTFALSAASCTEHVPVIEDDIKVGILNKVKSAGQFSPHTRVAIMSFDLNSLIPQ